MSLSSDPDVGQRDREPADSRSRAPGRGAGYAAGGGASPLSIEPGTTLSTTVAGITINVHSDLATVADIWRSFQETADATPFQRFGWMDAWQRHVGGSIYATPVVAIGADADGGLLFIFPLAIGHLGPLRKLVWLGTEICDYNAPLLAPDFPAVIDRERFLAIWRGLLDLLGNDPRTRFDWLDLEKMPDNVGAHPNPFMALPVQPNPNSAYIATLGDDWDAYYKARRSSSTRKTERRQLNRLADVGPVSLAEPESSEARQTSLDALISEKRRVFARMGIDDLFARPGYVDFYRAIATEPENRDFAHVSRLDLGTLVAAAGLGLVHRDCYYLILSSYHGPPLAQYGPGRAHLHELMRYAINHGFHRFDFTIGDEPYKRDWCDIEVKLYDHLAAATAGGALPATQTAAFRRLKRLIKQTPALRRLFVKARAAVGSKLNGSKKD